MGDMWSGLFVASGWRLCGLSHGCLQLLGACYVVSARALLRTQPPSEEMWGIQLQGPTFERRPLVSNMNVNRMVKIA